MSFRTCSILGLIWISGPIGAQAPDAIGRPPLERPRLPAPGEAGPRQPAFRLPDASTLLPPDGRLSSGLVITVRRFEIVGSTVFSADALQAEAAPFIGRPIGSEDLEELRLRLTRLYVGAGYVNSGAIIPDQEVRAGTVTIRIVEGVLATIELSGAHRFRPDYLHGRLAAGAGHPLSVPALQERMQLMLQNPQIERINAELAPGDRAGESRLRVAVHEAPRHTLGLAFANNRAPSVGSNRLEILGVTRNLLGVADVWSLRLGKSQGVDDYALNASIPVSARDTSLELRAEKNTSGVIEAPFSALDIDSHSKTLEIGLRHPWFRTLQQSLTVGAALSARESLTRLGGMPFSFSPGVHDGRSAVGVLRLSAEWLDRGQDHVFSARGVLNRGLDAFGASHNAEGLPDARFTTRLLQLQWVQRVGEAGASLLLRADVQSASAPLFALEKFAVGGADSVRGFRENHLIRDQGWLASAELRWPVARLAVPDLSVQPDDGRLFLALFADAGRAWDRGGRQDGLWGMGPGLRWDMSADSYAQLYWAARRKDIAARTNDLQDRGIHFKVVLQRHF